MAVNNSSNINATTPLPAAQGGTGVSNAGTLTLPANLIFSGANATTITLTAPTSVTLPVSGTLLSTAAAITVAQGGTGVSTLTTAYGVLVAGTVATGPVQTLAALGAAGTALTSNGAGALPSFQAIPSGSNPNLLINSNFQVWQRGTTGAALNTAAAYQVDRWQCYASNTLAIVVSRVAASNALSGQYGAQIQRTAGNATGGTTTFAQSIPISNLIGLASSVVTLTFTAKKGANFSGGGNLTVNINTGTGSTDVSNITTGFPGATNIASGVYGLTTSIATYTLTSSAAGSTATQLSIEFASSGSGTAGAADSYTIETVKVEYGASSTSYQAMGFDQTLQQCLPFYRKSFPYATAPAQNSGDSTGAIMYRCQIAAGAVPWSLEGNFDVVMRAAPTVTYYSPASATAKFRDLTTGADSASAVTNFISAKKLSVNNAGVAGDAAGDLLAVHYQGDSELV